MLNDRTQPLPSKEQIKTFPRFKNLPDNKIVVINTLKQCRSIVEELNQATLLGLDTESKPTFVKGEVQTGPHLIQLASTEKAYLFQVSSEILHFLKPFLENSKPLKIGFGLSNDLHLFRKKNIELQSVIELSTCFSSFGFTSPLGVKNAMALLFQINLPKSRSVSVSNWSKKNLTKAQIQYAAVDAYAPVLIFKALSDLNLIPAELAQVATLLSLNENKNTN